MNISIAVADGNRAYTERLSEVLQQYEELTIHIYTSGEKLKDSMESGRFDVVLFDPDISQERLAFPGVRLPICLYSDEARNTGMYADCVKVAKYQRISNIYKEIIREYAAKAGYSADFDHSQNTEVIAVYSPVGGSGKTTVALALASQLTSQGRSVLLVSAEQLSSSCCVNPKTEDGLVELLEAAGNERVNFELKLKGIVKQGINGMWYVEGFERLTDYGATTGDEMAEVLSKARRCGAWDVLVVDMDSSLDAIGRAIAALADRIVIVERTGQLPTAKMNLFARQVFVHEHQNKLVRVWNFAENNSQYSTELNIPVVGTIHNYGNLQLGDMIRAINRNGEIGVEHIVRK